MEAGLSNVEKMVVVVSFIMCVFIKYKRESLEGQFRHEITVRVFHFFSDIILYSKESLAGLVRSPELLLYSVKSIKENKQ